MSKDKPRKEQANVNPAGTTAGVAGQNQQQKTAQKSAQPNNNGSMKQ